MNTDFDWDFVLDKIQEEKCVLVLGPELYTDEQGETYHRQLINHLTPQNNPNIYRHYEVDDFFLFDDQFKRTLTCHQIKRFYQNKEPGPLLKKLSEIPFHVLLTVTPDKLLHKAFDHNDFAFQYGYYKKNKDPQLIRKPTRKLPLIYHVFGCIENEESMILSYNDLYDYFKSIFAFKSMPDQLKFQLNEIRNIIFLGVPFDKWYMQLLLRELNIHRQEFAFTRFAANQSMSKELKSFCFDQFRINFIQKNISEFVDKLYEKASEQGILRQVGDERITEIEKIKHLIAEGELEQAIDLSIDYTMGSSLNDLALKLLGTYRKFQKRVRNGILYEEQKQVQESRIIAEIIELTNAATKM